MIIGHYKIVTITKTVSGHIHLEGEIRLPLGEAGYAKNLKD